MNPHDNDSQDSLASERAALQTIADWSLPATGRFWDGEQTRPVSYESEYGSNGARDYMRAVARAALATPAAAAAPAPGDNVGAWVDYAPVYEFALLHKLPFNELSAMVRRASLATPAAAAEVSNPTTAEEAERMLQTGHFFLYGRVFRTAAAAEPRSALYDVATDPFPAVAAEPGAPGATDAERAEWLADKIVSGGDYAKEAATMLRRWPTPVAAAEPGPVVQGEPVAPSARALAIADQFVSHPDVVRDLATLIMNFATPAAAAEVSSEPLLSEDELCLLQRVDDDVQMFAQGRYPYENNSMPNQRWRRATIADVEKRFKLRAPRFTALCIKLERALATPAAATEPTDTDICNLADKHGGYNVATVGLVRAALEKWGRCLNRAVWGPELHPDDPRAAGAFLDGGKHRATPAAAAEAGEALKPCPFCGEQPEIVTRDVEPQNDHWYSGKKETFVLCQCGACLFDGAFHEGFWDAETRAVAAWNLRATPAAAAEVSDAPLRRIGGQMANVMFNVAQRRNEGLTAAMFDTMDDLRKQWDAAILALRTAGSASLKTHPGTEEAK